MYQDWMEKIPVIEDIKINDVNRCEYCREDFDGYYRPLDKNAHVSIFDTPHKKYLDINWYGHKMQIDITYCPMCGRKLGEEEKQ